MDGADDQQSEGKTNTHTDTVQSRFEHAVFACKHLSTAKNDTVYNDQRQEDTQCAVNIRHIRLKQSAQQGYKACDYNNVARDTDFVRNYFL